MKGMSNDKIFSEFQEVFEEAWKDKNDEILKSLIYPHRISSLHYFAISKNK